VELDYQAKGNPATSRMTPAYHTVILSKDEEGENHRKEDFDYRQVIGNSYTWKNQPGQILHAQYTSALDSVQHQRHHIHRQ